MPGPTQPRDLLAERIRRLESRISELGDRIGTTGDHVDRAGQQLDALIGIVGRLGRVVDVQGDSLADDENHLEQKVGALEMRLSELARGVLALAAQMEALDPEAGPSKVGRGSRTKPPKTGPSSRRTKKKTAATRKKKTAAARTMKKTAETQTKKTAATRQKKKTAATRQKKAPRGTPTSTGKKAGRPPGKVKT